ncbi:hypothetical protein ACRRTK_018982 [Alexandromys fortis]
MLPRRKPSSITKLTDFYDQGLYSVMEIVLLDLPLQKGTCCWKSPGEPGTSFGEQDALDSVLYVNNAVFPNTDICDVLPGQERILCLIGMTWAFSSAVSFVDSLSIEAGAWFPGFPRLLPKVAEKSEQGVKSTEGHLLETADTGKSLKQLQVSDSTGAAGPPPAAGLNLCPPTVRSSSAHLSIKAKCKLPAERRGSEPFLGPLRGSPNPCLPDLRSSSKWKSAWLVTDSPRALQQGEDLGCMECPAPVRGKNKRDSDFCKNLGREACHHTLWVLWDEMLSRGEKPSSSVPSGELPKAALGGDKPGLPVRKSTHYFSS